GLLHELGSLAMAKVEGSNYCSLVGRIGSRDQLERERRAYGFSHCDIGALAVQRWNLFPGAEETIQFHHDPLAAERLGFSAPVLRTVYLIALTTSTLRPAEADEGHRGTLLDRLGTNEDLVREEVNKAEAGTFEYLKNLQ
ncbi:MAG: HDOD domain-containing protein, partial [Deltaproteobacteria bacterium]|nr:HDOD domain-containing protein [Deltaproteobacteria bacterium]